MGEDVVRTASYHSATSRINNISGDDSPSRDAYTAISASSRSRGDDRSREMSASVYLAR